MGALQSGVSVNAFGGGHERRYYSHVDLGLLLSGLAQFYQLIRPAQESGLVGFVRCIGCVGCLDWNDCVLDAEIRDDWI